jgi:hypothetical protein
MSLTRLQPNSVIKTANYTFGNVTANYFLGDGSQLTGITVSGGTAITNGTSNVNAALNGNVTIGVAGTNDVVIVSNNKVTVAGNVSATYFIGNGSQLTGIAGGGSTYANSNVADYLPTYTGNVSANYFIGNGSQLTGLPASYSNTNVAAYLPTYTGNVSANYFIGNGSTLTNITGANVTGYVSNATNANTAITAGTVTTAAQPNITSVGTLSSLTVSGLVTATGTGIKVANVQDSTGTITLTTKYNNQAGDVGVYGNITAGTNGTGNVTATYFIGNGSQLTSITATTATTAGTVTTTAQPNITSTGTLTSLIIGGQATFQQSIEVLTTKTSATGTVDHDFSTGAIFYHTSPSANFTANFTNVPTTDNRAVVITLVIVQGATAYLPTAVQIAGVGQTIKWSGGSAPTGTNSGINPVTFALFRVGATWTVTGLMGAYS